MIAAEGADPDLCALARGLCAFVTDATGRWWPDGLIAAMALLLAAVADFDEGRATSQRYRPRNNLIWLRGQTTHDHSNPVVRRVIDVYDVPEPVAVELCHIALGTEGYDETGVVGSSSALHTMLSGTAAVTDRVAQRWAASLARAVAGGPVAKTVTNRIRREVERYRRDLVAIDVAVTRPTTRDEGFGETAAPARLSA